MPFQSEKQRRYLHANHPEIAKRWERDYAGGGRIGYRLGTEKEPKQNNLSGILENITQEQVDQDPDRYAQLLIELRPPDLIMGSHGNQMAYWTQHNGDQIGVPWGYTHSNLDYYPKAQGGRIGFNSGTNYKTRKELIEEADLEERNLLDVLSEKTRVGSDKYNIKLSPEA